VLECRKEDWRTRRRREEKKKKVTRVGKAGSEIVSKHCKIKAKNAKNKCVFTYTTILLLFLK
jgi:hypothetical protein